MKLLLKQALSCVLLPDLLLEAPSGEKDTKVVAEGRGFLTGSVSWVLLVQDQREKPHVFQRTSEGKRQSCLRLNHTHTYNFHSQAPG